MNEGACVLSKARWSGFSSVFPDTKSEDTFREKFALFSSIIDYKFYKSHSRAQLADDYDITPDSSVEVEDRCPVLRDI